MSGLAVKVDGLTFTYAGSSVPALNGVSLRVGRGEFIIVTGPSGCGKSTLCRCLNGLIPHFYPGRMEGDVEVFGMNTRIYTPKHLAKFIGLVFQNPENQLFSLSVEGDVAFGPENLGFPREETVKRVEEALSLMGLKGVRERAPYELSGGQQQRAAIASILAMRPEIIVLDEPTSFLDPKSSLDIIEAISLLNRSLGITVVLVEHRLDIASRFADKIYIMDKGRVVDEGMPSEVYGRRETLLLGVGVPRISLLFQLLRERGVPVGGIPVTVKDGARMLEALLVDRS
ncbi:MAG: ATP-binding cassette domain-containing protein [Candidatus Bathyarchaeia archaeon]